MKYRAEIDGLRAIAVLPVIFFHAGFQLFSGGVVGVDVFFVISGYLITTILIEDIENNRFSFMSFYERRARRILPALFFVILVCIPFAWIWMLPNQMKDFSQSLIAVSLFASNIFFWKQSGYFDAVSEEKPLLHTWSLAIEEQYYFLFPIFLLLSWRFGKNKVFWLIVAMAACSLLLSEWGWRNKASANFYLAPTRVWELFAGSIAAFIVQKRATQKNDTLSVLGFAAIIFSIFAYDEFTPFPSVYTLVPVVGAVLIVLFAEKETLVAKLLSTKVFVGIGLISYSAYLWHQPLFAFARVTLANEASLSLMLLLSMLSLTLAYFSWNFIEKPFRSAEKGTFSRNHIFLLSSISISAMLFFGFSGYKTNGFEELMLEYKFTGQERTQAKLVFEAINYDMYNEMASKECHLWARNTNLLDINKLNKCRKLHGKAIVVLGDSHAMNLFNIISFSNAYPFVIGVSRGGCRPHNNKVFCHYDAFDNFISNNPAIIDLVVFHQSGSYFIKDKFGRVDSQKAFNGHFNSFDDNNVLYVKDYLNRLASNYDLNVLWVGPFLEYRWRPQEKLFTPEINEVNPVSRELFDKLEDRIATLLIDQKLFKYRPYNTIFFEPYRSFVKRCFMFRDADHYSRCGEIYISRKLKPGFLDAELKK